MTIDQAQELLDFVRYQRYAHSFNGFASALEQRLLKIIIAADPATTRPWYRMDHPSIPTDGTPILTWNGVDYHVAVLKGMIAGPIWRRESDLEVIKPHPTHWQFLDEPPHDPDARRTRSTRV